MEYLPGLEDNNYDYKFTGVSMKGLPSPANQVLLFIGQNTRQLSRGDYCRDSRSVVVRSPMVKYYERGLQNQLLKLLRIEL